VRQQEKFTAERERETDRQTGGARNALVRRDAPPQPQEIEKTIRVDASENYSRFVSVEHRVCAESDADDVLAMMVTLILTRSA
jgi:Txe/YoeB family toxin of Txe-Axe toxin-antitoxin module